MMDPSVEPSEQTEEPVRHFIQRVLRFGLVLSFLLMLLGYVMAVAGGSLGPAPAVRLFDIANTPNTAELVMALGVLVLALTPAVRALSLLVLWARERDWRFVGVAVAVVLVLGVAASLGGG